MTTLMSQTTCHAVWYMVRKKKTQQNGNSSFNIKTVKYYYKIITKAQYQENMVGWGYKIRILQGKLMRQIIQKWQSQMFYLYCQSNLYQE